MVFLPWYAWNIYSHSFGVRVPQQTGLRQLGSRKGKVRFSHCPSTAQALSASSGLCQGGNSPPAALWPLSFLFFLSRPLRFCFCWKLQLSLVMLKFIRRESLFCLAHFPPALAIPAGKCHPCTHRPVPEGTGVQDGILNSLRIPCLASLVKEMEVKKAGYKAVCAMKSEARVLHIKAQKERSNHYQ